ncbi:MAG: hypothetical protein ACTSPI_00775 [Candidatus Heimdallarchaeaceae archaeon]
MKLLTLDTGGITGFAIFQDGYLVNYGEFPTWEGLPVLIPESDLVLYEEIRVARASFNPIGLEVIGVVKFLCERAKVKYTSQFPSQIKGAYQWPMYDFSEIRSQHITDAICHGIVYLGLEKAKIPQKFLK